MKLFLYVKEFGNVIMAGALPEDFDPAEDSLTLGGSTLRGINWTNVDYEITDSILPDDIGIMDKYQYIDGEIIPNPGYVAGAE